jgi:hypothetical protein
MKGHIHKSNHGADYADVEGQHRDLAKQRTTEIKGTHSQKIMLM